MKSYVGWMKEKLHQSVNKLIVVRNCAAAGASEPRFRVVKSYYYGHGETMYTLKIGDVVRTFLLRLDNELYYRSETQVNVVDFDTHSYLSFSRCLVLGILPDELAQFVKTQQIKKLVDEKRKEGSNIVLIGVIGLTAGVCIALGVFLGYYLTVSGMLGGVSAPITVPVPTVTPIFVPPAP